MPKYRIELGSLVTKLMQRTYTVSAPNEQMAIERAEKRFRNACKKSPVYIDCGGTINVDDIKVVEE